MLSNSWRISAIAPWDGGALSLNTLHLYAGATRQDADAALTCSHVPVVGALSDLQSATPAGAVIFSADAVRSSGFFLQWDFPAPLDVSALHIATGTDISELSLFAKITGRWLLAGLAGLRDSSPVDAKIVQVPARDPLVGAAACLPGDTLADAVSGTNWVASAGAAVQTGIIKDLTPTLKLNKQNSVYYPTAVPAFTNWTGGDVTVEAYVYIYSAATGSIGRPLTVFNGEASATIVYWAFGPRANGSLELYFWSGVENSKTTAPGVVPLTDWTHIAVSCQGGILRFFVGGALIHSVALGVTPVGSGSTQPLRIGSTSGIFAGSGEFAVSDLIFTPSAKYTASFQPAGRSAPRQHIHGPDTAHIAASSHVPPPSALSAPPLLLARDTEFGGNGTVYGTTEIKGTPDAPLRARVRLIRERDGLVYRETWSDGATGAYRFDNVDELETYTVLTYHPTRDRRAVVADGIIPEVSA